MTTPRHTPSAVLADLANALQRARQAAPADRITAWRLHTALDDAEGCLGDVEAELDRLAGMVAEATARAEGMDVEELQPAPRGGDWNW